jgi:predicted metal-binding membrane protein
VIEAALRRDRLVVVAGLALVTVAAWGWTLAGVGMPIGARGGVAMSEAIDSAATTPASWSPAHALMMFAMWWVMMVAMMVPSAAPLVLLATAVHRRKGADGRPDLAAGLLTAGYLVVWGGFSLVATLAQWGLELAGLLSPETMAAGPAVAGASCWRPASTS